MIQIRARAIIERDRKGEREYIVITELPYQTNKAKFIERVAELVQEKTIEGISNIRDESDREGMRVVIELKRNEVAEVILNQLYKHTQMQTSFGIILLAIHQNQPKLLPLKEILHLFLQHRQEVVTRRSLFELKKAEARAHILEGLEEGHRPDRCDHRHDSGLQNAQRGQRPVDRKICLFGRTGPGHPGDEAPAVDQPGTAEDRRGI